MRIGGAYRLSGLNVAPGIDAAAEPVGEVMVRIFQAF